MDVYLVYNKTVKYNTAILYLENKSILFDYSDDVEFVDLPEFYDYYFKLRSYNYQNVYLQQSENVLAYSKKGVEKAVILGDQP